MKQYSRVYATVNLDAIVHNMEEMHRVIDSHTRMIAVIKTDGYGHGAVMIAKELETLPYVFGYAVATYDEAHILRREGLKKPILILGYSFPEQYEAMCQEEIRPAVFSYETACQLSQAAQRTGRDLSIHIKIDTGMSRIGMQVTEESAQMIAQIAALPHIVIEGIFTHFARADERDKTAAHVQLEQFLKMIAMVEKKGIEIPFKHCSNSAGIMELPEANMDLVRAGITLYGLMPSEEMKTDVLNLQPVMELKSQVVHVKTLEAGRAISYGGTYVTPASQTIATIPVGYGDGYARALSNKGYVLIHGQKAPICGRVCMDQFMVNVTDIADVKVGDTVTLLGKDQNAQITMEQLGEISGRFNYEFACDLGKRIPRVFQKNGNTVATQDCFGNRSLEMTGASQKR